MLKSVNIKIRVLLTIVVLFLSVIIDWSLIYLVIACEAIILLFPLYYQNIFLFFRLISLLLYYSYFIETGSYFTYGGDDLGFVSRFIKDRSWLTFDELVSGNIINYPLFYYVNKCYHYVFLKSVNFNLISVHLVVINNFILTLAFVFYRKISQAFFKKDYSLYLLFLTPLIYFGSIHIRDVYNFLFYAIAFYAFISNNKFRTYIAFLCLFLSFFIRPETSIIFIIMILFFAKNNIYRIIPTLFLVFIIFYYFPLLDGLFRNFDQLNEIYNQTGLGLSSATGIGEFLRTSDSTIFQILWYIYNIYKPIPPYLFVEFSFENLYNFFGNLFWYVAITFIFLKFNKVFSNKYLRFNIIAFLVYVFFISFIGGTQRHSMMFFPFIFLHFIHLNYKIQFKTVLIFIGFFITVFSYALIK